MKTLNMKVVHRLLAVSLLNEEGKKGATLTDLKNLLKIMEKVELKEDEKQEAEVVVDNETSRVKWNAEKDIEKDIELSDEEFSKLREVFKRKNDEKAFSFDTLNPMLELAEKLGIEV